MENKTDVLLTITECDLTPTRGIHPDRVKGKRQFII